MRARVPEVRKRSLEKGPKTQNKVWRWCLDAFRTFFDGPHPEGPAIEKIQSRSKISIPAWNFQSRSKFSISIENFNPAVFLFTGPSWCYREGLDRKFQSTIDRSKFAIPKAAIKCFESPGPLGKTPSGRSTEPQKKGTWVFFCAPSCG